MFAAFFTFVFITAAYAANDLPSYIRLCGRNSPSDVYGQCIVDNINNIKSTICSQGLPEFDLPPIEPIVIDKVVIYDTKNLKLNVVDAKIRGICSFDKVFHNVSSDKLRFELATTFTNLTLDAVYDFDIQLLVSLANKGLIRVISDEVLIKLDIELKEVTKNGKTQIYASKVKSKADITKFAFEFNDKEGGDLSQLHDILSKTINDNSKEIMIKFAPICEQEISKIFMSIFNKVAYNRFEQLFPDEA